jgi:hypothetical protein
MPSNNDDGYFQKINPDPHVIVMTHAGKPIFSTWPSNTNEQLNNVCGLIQALRASILNDEALGHGEELQFVKMMNCDICFWTVGAITLVAVSKNAHGMVEGGDSCATEAYLRLLLEQIYCGMIFLLTDSLQGQLMQNPNLDMGRILGSTSSILNRILDGMSIDSMLRIPSESGFGKDDGPWTRLGGVHIFGPVPYEVCDDYY